MATTSPYTRFGQKGLGEGGAIAPPAALTNAAKKGLGVELLVSPVTLRAGGGGDQGGRHGLNYGSLSTTYDRV
jgi:hypothetical protein